MFVNMSFKKKADHYAKWSKAVGGSSVTWFHSHVSEKANQAQGRLEGRLQGWSMGIKFQLETKKQATPVCCVQRLDYP